MFWYLLLGILLGAVCTCIGVLRLRIGVLKVYIPDIPDEPPYLYSELSTSVESVCTKKFVLFKVDVRNINSQK